MAANAEVGTVDILWYGPFYPFDKYISLYVLGLDARQFATMPVRQTMNVIAGV